LGLGGSGGSTLGFVSLNSSDKFIKWDHGNSVSQSSATTKCLAKLVFQARQGLECDGEFARRLRKREVLKYTARLHEKHAACLLSDQRSPA
jgi:hypothetical protein